MLAALVDRNEQGSGCRATSRTNRGFKWVAQHVNNSTTILHKRHVRISIHNLPWNWEVFLQLRWFDFGSSNPPSESAGFREEDPCKGRQAGQAPRAPGTMNMSRTVGSSIKGLKKPKWSSGVKKESSEWWESLMMSARPAGRSRPRPPRIRRGCGREGQEGQRGIKKTNMYGNYIVAPFE